MQIFHSVSSSTLFIGFVYTCIYYNMYIVFRIFSLKILYTEYCVKEGKNWIIQQRHADWRHIVLPTDIGYHSSHLSNGQEIRDKSTFFFFDTGNDFPGHRESN